MYMPVDEHGNWLTISILNCNTLCAFQSAGEVIETADMFQPSLKVRAKAIDLETWEHALAAALGAGIPYAVEFLVLGSPKVIPIREMLEDVRNRLVRKRQHALRRSQELNLIR